MNATNTEPNGNWKKILHSIDDFFILAGIILNGFSTITSFIYGHKIAGIILLVCEILFISIYVMKMI